MYDPFSDPSRVYYGTDTRALAPLLGAALAIAVRPWRHRERLPRRTRHCWTRSASSRWCCSPSWPPCCTTRIDALYLGGFLVIAALGAVVVGVAGHPGTALGEMLGTQPWRWLGERSYAIYLWHWPVCVLTRPGVDVPITGWANAGLRIALTIVLADISYRLIETPIRRNGLIAPFKARGAAKARHREGRGGGGPTRVARVRVRARSHRAPLRPVFRSVALMLVMVVGGSAVGVQLSTAARCGAAGWPGRRRTGPNARATALRITVERIAVAGPVADREAHAASPQGLEGRLLRRLAGLDTDPEQAGGPRRVHRGS